MMVGEWWLKEKEGLMGLGYGLFRVFSERGIKAYCFFLFFSLSRWQLGFGIMGLGFFCVYAFWKRMWEQNFGPLLIFLVWDSHLFIGKIICLFPPHCLVPKTLWSLIFFLCTLVPSSKYFLLFFWKMLEKAMSTRWKKSTILKMAH
jgi:hypothetical protein